MTSWKLDKSAIKNFSISCLDANASWNSSWVQVIILLSSMLELDLGHEFASYVIIQSIDCIITWLEHQVFPKVLR